MTASLSRCWSLLIIAMLALSMMSLLFMWRASSGGHSRVLDSLDSVLISVEALVTGERSEPTPKANQLLELDLGGEVQALFALAEANEFSTYEEFPQAEWPSAIQRLNPVAIVYFDSRSQPDGDGVLIVVERGREWDSGVLICRQRNSEWQGVHLNGHIVSAGPDFGFRRLQKDGFFWHWYRSSWASTRKGGPAADSKPNIPVFQYSNIPVFQHSNTQYDLAVNLTV